jgi:phosphoglycerate dehydrogenase-like enzyme
MLILGQLATNERFFTAPPEFLDAIAAALPPEATFRACSSSDELRAHLPEATGVVGWPFPSALLRKAPKLRFVHLLTAGVPEGLEAACASLRLSHSGGLNAQSVAEHALFLVLAAARGVALAGLSSWQPDSFRPARPLATLRVLVLGYGPIGQALATSLEPLVGSLTVVSRRPRSEPSRRVLGFESLAEVARGSDVIVVALPNRPETRALFGAAFFGSLVDDVALINVARGALVDEEALLGFLGSHPSARYLTDVTAPEPYPDDGALRSNPSVLITPHVGGRSIDVWPALAQRAIVELRAAIAGASQAELAATPIAPPIVDRGDEP